MASMRLFKRGKYWHIQLSRGVCRSTKATREEDARAIFREVKREYLKGRLLKLEPGKRVLLSEFAKAYVARTYASTKTAKADELALRLLGDVVGNSTPLAMISQRGIENFKAACLARGCKPVTVNSYLRHIKAALGVAEEWYPEYRRPRIKLCKVGARLPRALSPDQIRKLLDTALEDDPEFYDILVVYLWTGIRRSELLTLRWDGVDFAGKGARVIGKGNKERIVPLLPEVLAVLETRVRDVGRVFPGCHPDTITHRFRRLARTCGFSCRLHDLRHSAATYMLASGTPINVVQAILGHASVSTTQIYAKTLAEVARREMRLSYE
jgi:integrase